MKKINRSLVEPVVKEGGMSREGGGSQRAKEWRDRAIEEWRDSDGERDKAVVLLNVPLQDV